MSVRRLAEVQPESFEFTPENMAWAQAQIAKYPPGRQASAVIPLLWKAQAQNDYWLPRAAIERVAQMLDMPTIRVMEVATFYTMFNLEPVGRHFIQLCGTTPCMLRGANDIRKVLETRIGEQRHVSADGKFAWLEVECLGACCNAPMVQINDDYFEDLTVENFEKLLDDLAAGRPVKKGSQTGKTSSEPEPGKGTTLTDATLYDGSVVGAWRERFEEDRRAAEAAAAAAAAAAAEKKAAEAEAAAKQEESEIAAKLATLPADATPEQKANAVGARPQPLAGPRGAKGDDLKLIKGIGPVNEGKLHELGVYHFDQIANWTALEARWVGVYLAFPGRIAREDWIGQAKSLAAGKK
jgi:NADH-quinone oxidoreductase subunit E